METKATFQSPADIQVRLGDGPRGAYLMLTLRGDRTAYFLNRNKFFVAGSKRPEWWGPDCAAWDRIAKNGTRYLAIEFQGRLQGRPRQLVFGEPVKVPGPSMPAAMTRQAAAEHHVMEHVRHLETTGSPKANHEVRGHNRRLSGGRTTWVRAHRSGRAPAK